MKFIALDIGNVIFNFTYDIIPSLSKTLNISEQDALRFLKEIQPYLDLGLTTIEQELYQKFSIKSDSVIKRLIDVWEKSLTPNLNFINMLVDLKSTTNLQIALLSNIGFEHANLIKNCNEFASIYNDAVLYFSCYVGARKPCDLFYQSFLIQYPEFKGCLYIDDLTQNLVAGSKFKFKTHEFSLQDTDYNNKINEIKNLVLQ
jgi:FMN phosphatase YigB (HAD superfamily)